MDNEHLEYQVLKYVSVVGSIESKDKLSILRTLIKELSKTNVPVDELASALVYFLTRTEALRMYVYPNFHIGWISGPRGYVLDLNPTSPFNFEPFRTNLFRHICIYEIGFKQELLSKETITKFRDISRKTIPIEQAAPIKLDEDTKESGWSECLGMSGSRIGVYRAHDHSEASQDAYRYFVVVDTGLPEQTMNLLARKMCETTMENINILEEGRKEPHVQYGQLLAGPGSLFDRLEEISLANNKRLAYRFMRNLDLEPISHEITNIPLISVETETEDYRPSPHKDFSYSSQLIEEALSYWPVNCPVSPWTTIQALPLDKECTPEAKAIFPSSEGLKNFPLGVVIDHMDPKERIKALTRLQYQSKPMYVEPLVRTSVNVARQVDPYTIRYYDNCTPVPKDGSGLIRPLQTIMGYEVVGSKYFYSTCADSTVEWTNDVGSGYPIRFKFIPSDTDTKVSAQNQMIFCSLSHGINDQVSTAPRQLRGTFVNLNEFKPTTVSYSQVNGDIFRQSVRLEPVFVYLSPKPVPEHEIDMFHVDPYAQ